MLLFIRKFHYFVFNGWAVSWSRTFDITGKQRRTVNIFANNAIPLLEVTDAAVATNAKNLANSYRSVFPTAEECFFAELKEGATYTINCGLAKGLTTKVRYRAQ